MDKFCPKSQTETLKTKRRRKETLTERSMMTVRIFSFTNVLCFVFASGSPTYQGAELLLDGHGGWA